MKREVIVFAPATVANWGPGYDLLGAAVAGLGDTVKIRTLPDQPGVIRIASITGDGGKLPLKAEENTAGIAAIEARKLIGREELGMEITLHKGLPLGSGLGSSAASAAAAAHAVNILCDEPIAKRDLMPALLEAESAVSGWHADNAAPALLGGFVLVTSYEPLTIIDLPTPDDLFIALVTPAISVKTKDARAALPKEIPLSLHVANSGHFGAMLAGLYSNDVRLFAQSTIDRIVEPARSSLIPGFYEAKAAALEAGALGCSISGGGPTLFAIAATQEAAQQAADAMQQAFREAATLDSKALVTRVDTEGAQVQTEAPSPQ